MKNIIIILICLIVNLQAFADEQSFYFRGDEHTVNGITAYRIYDEQSASLISCFASGVLGEVGIPTGYYASDIYIRHEDGSETLLGSLVAETTRNALGAGYQDGTWDCPRTPIVTNDAIKIVEKTMGDMGDAKTWITDQLGWIELSPSTWIFRRYTKLDVEQIKWTRPYLFLWQFYIHHGTTTYNTVVENIKFTPLIDIGLYINTESGIVKIGVQELDAHNLRIRKDGKTYGIPLLPKDGPNASPVRIFDGKGIKALPEYR